MLSGKNQSNTNTSYVLAAPESAGAMASSERDCSDTGRENLLYQGTIPLELLPGNRRSVDGTSMAVTRLVVLVQCRLVLVGRFRPLEYQGF